MNIDTTTPQDMPEHPLLETDDHAEIDYDADDQPMLLPKREKLLTKGTVLLAVLLIGAGGFTLGGYLKKSPAAAAPVSAAGVGVAARGSGATGRNASATGATGANAATPAAAGGGGGGSAGFAGGATSGQITSINGGTIVVTDNQGNSIRINTTASTPINVAKAGAVGDLTVGEPIIVQGTAGADGAINATAVNAGAAFATRGGRAAAAGTPTATGPTGAGAASRTGATTAAG